MKNITSILKRLTSNDGAEIAEAAMVLPLVFLMLLGAVWFGRAYNIYSTIQQAAQQGALAAARSQCVTCGDNANANVFNRISNVMQASNLDTSQIKLPSAPNCAPAQTCAACPSPPWPASSCSTANNVYVCQNVQLNPGSTPVQCGTVVSFQYPFTFNVPLFSSLGMANITMSAQAQSRVED